ncbi:MAG: hypothetical protein IJ958_10700 [Agathobacter sp.]|nr:hypothetical protein [Agathobacter sp.]
MSTNKNKITKRIVYSVELTLDAPLCVSSGEKNYTDTDVQRDFDGNPFVPGTSIAGAIRNYFENVKGDVAVFGTEGSDSRMSSIYFSDFKFVTTPKVDIRDGVKLENKVAKDTGKYDMEIIDTSAKGILEIEVIQRENDTVTGDQKENMIKEALTAIHSGDVRFGANKNRGFGKMLVVAVKRGEFTAENKADWLSYCNGENVLKEYKEAEWKTDIENVFVTFSYALKLDGGISIRKYSMTPDTPDYTHISSANKPIIPGTSLNGAIRSRAKLILEELGYSTEKSAVTLDEWFGYVEEKTREAKQSEIIINESVILGGEDLDITRVKVNRFAASAVESALYRERSHFGGTTQIEVKIRKNHRDCDAMCGLMLLVLKDLANGYLAVGGQTAIGRGIFKGDVDLKNESRYLLALKQFVEGAK